ncbi:MAG: thioredoxin domain-containing protein [Bacteroidota bacterium]
MEKQRNFYNHLVHENSSYLLQHSDNPVDWFPWGNEAFKKAKQENKLVLVSIGYSSCHWCHVMEEESFKDEEVAEIMNKYYICIKVDREERPDIDHVYMDAIQILTGAGGWPLNVFTLPDGKPVYGGTYFPKEQWKEVLLNLAESFFSQPEKVKEQAERISQGVSEMQLNILSGQKSKEFQESDVKAIIEGGKKHIDYYHGGVSGAPKFPMPGFHSMLLKYFFYAKDEKIKEYINKTLKNISNGGIYDHLEGGFARYSTDNEWKIPHFEKMLYDNAQLASLYSKAYLLTGVDTYKKITEETLEFLRIHMYEEGGAFFSSYDADSEGQEGKYYTWSEKEIKNIFLDDADIIADYFGITKDGDIDGRNVLHINKGIDKLKEKYNLPADQIESIVENARKKLLEKRVMRKRPDLDTKVIVSWNALAINAFIDGYKATQKRQYLRIALESAEFLISHQLQKDYRLNRLYYNGKSTVNAFLDDYAFFIDALIQLYQVTFDAKWIDWAMKLSEYALTHFELNNSSLLQYKSSLDESLVSPKIEIIDSVIPSSNSIMAKNLFVLGQYFYSDSYLTRARNMLKEVQPAIEKSSIYFANWIDLMLWFVYPPYEIFIVGRKSEDYKQQFMHFYHPGIILAGGSHEGNLPILRNRFKLGKTQIYICQGRVCKQPLNNVDEALKMIS